MTLYDCKLSYVRSFRTFFPDHPIFLNILSVNGKTHQHFVQLHAVLSAHHLDPKRYIPFVFSLAERPLRVSQLAKSAWITRYQHEHPQMP